MPSTAVPRQRPRDQLCHVQSSLAPIAGNRTDVRMILLALSTAPAAGSAGMRYPPGSSIASRAKHGHAARGHATREDIGVVATAVHEGQRSQHIVMLLLVSTAGQDYSSPSAAVGWGSQAIPRVARTTERASKIIVSPALREGGPPDHARARKEWGTRGCGSPPRVGVGDGR